MKVRRAALAVYAERGWSAFGFNAVAERAGVGKPGIYSRWESPVALLVDAFKSFTPPLERFVSKGLREDLIYIATMYANVLEGERGLASHRMLLDHPNNPEVFDLLADTISNPRLALLYSILRGSVASGEIPADCDLSPVGDLLLGGVFFATVRSRTNSIDEETIRGIVDGVLRAVRYTGAQHPESNSGPPLVS